MLTETQKRDWEENGFLVIPALFSADEADAISEQVEATWSHRTSEIVVDDLVTGKRSRIGDVTEADEVAHRFKVNDLYLLEGSVRNACLDDRVTDVVAALLGDTPALCNSLNLDQGSEQDDHIDSLFMTPQTPGRLIATWLALEDTHPDAGPLRYYPGSHKIPLYRFLNGGHNANDQELPDWHDYINLHIGKRDLKADQFLAKKGDLFIWHANLVHGGGRINSDILTRKSLVSHYWGYEDCSAQALDLVHQKGAYWIRRPHQPVRTSIWRARVAPVLRQLRRHAIGRRRH